MFANSTNTLAYYTVEAMTKQNVFVALFKKKSLAETSLASIAQPENMKMFAKNTNALAYYTVATMTKQNIPL